MADWEKSLAEAGRAGDSVFVVVAVVAAGAVVPVAVAPGSSEFAVLDWGFADLPDRRP